jgi:hypothetical protein
LQQAIITLADEPSATGTTDFTSYKSSALFRLLPGEDENKRAVCY